MEIRRGNYKLFEFTRKDKNEVAIETRPEKMYFTVKENPYVCEALIQKILKENGGITFNDEDFSYRIEILPEDTEDLAYGDYFYDIEIVNDDKPKTIAVGTFTIKEVATHKCNEVGYDE